MDSGNTDDILELHASPERKNEDEPSEESLYVDANDQTFKDSSQNEIANEEQERVLIFLLVGRNRPIRIHTSKI